jgi:hypothetical protein
LASLVDQSGLLKKSGEPIQVPVNIPDSNDSLGRPLNGGHEKQEDPCESKEAAYHGLRLSYPRRKIQLIMATKYISQLNCARNGVFEAQYPAHRCLCLRFDECLAAFPAKLEVRTIRYFFPVRLFHSRRHAGLARRMDGSKFDRTLIRADGDVRANLVRVPELGPL